MDSFNKVISFVLGLVVVLVFFAVVTGRLKLPGRLSTPFSKSTATSTPTPTPISIVKIGDNSKESVLGNNYKAQITPTKTISRPGEIPATGLPTLFVPTLLTGAVGGFFLRRAGRK